MQQKIGDVHNEIYIKQMEKLAYHRSCYKILGKHHVAGVRHKAFESTPGEISTRSMKRSKQHNRWVLRYK